VVVGVFSGSSTCASAEGSNLSWRSLVLSADLDFSIPRDVGCDVGREAWGLETIRVGLAIIRGGLATMRVGLTDGDLAVSVRVLDGGLDEGVSEASGRVRCGGLPGGEITAARDGGLLPANRTVGFGDIALWPSPSVGDFALCPSPSVGDLAL
jgi:hypothetical protein